MNLIVDSTSFFIVDLIRLLNKLGVRYLHWMMLHWLRFDRRLFQLLKLLDLRNIIHIYGWWALLFWPIEWILGIAHLIGIGHALQCFFGFQARTLNEDEILLAKSVYGDQLDLSIIKLNTRSKISKRFRIAFVTGHVINYHSSIIPGPLLIHELMHVYQYEQVGMVYIPRCLFAQASAQGYHFGSIEDHQDLLLESRSINKLNYEQQAEFLESLFCHKSNQQEMAFSEVSFHDVNMQV